MTTRRAGKRCANRAEWIMTITGHDNTPILGPKRVITPCAKWSIARLNVTSTTGVPRGPAFGAYGPRSCANRAANGSSPATITSASNPNTALSLDENAGEVTATVQASNPDSDNTVLSGDRATISGQGNPGITVKATSEGHIWAYSGTENGEAPFYSSEIPESSLYIDEGTLTTQVPVSDDAILWIMTRIEDLAETHFQVEDSLVFTDIVDSTTISGLRIHIKEFFFRQAFELRHFELKPMDKAQVVVEITEEL